MPVQTRSVCEVGARCTFPQEVAPRITVPEPVVHRAFAGEAADLRQLRRGMRVLLQQGGGTMLLTLRGAHAGARVRLDFALADGAPTVSATTADAQAAELVRTALLAR